MILSVKVRQFMSREFLCGLLFFLSSGVFFFWNTWYSRVIVILLYVICFSFVTTKDYKQILIGILFTILYCYMAINSIGSFAFSGVFNLLLLPCLFFIKHDAYDKIFESLMRIFALFIAFSAIIYVIVVFMYVDIPHMVISNPEKEYMYYKYPFLVIPDHGLNMLLPRFCGLYDEPGVVGTYSAVFLLCKKYDIVNNKYLIPIFLAGLLSLSLAFYAISILYLLLFASHKMKLLVTLLSFLFLLFVSHNNIDIDIFLNRFKIEDGALVGENRTSSTFDAYYNNFAKSDAYYFGLGPLAGIEFGAESSSYKVFIVKYGVVCFVLYLFLLVINSMIVLKSKRMILTYALVIILILYQRPWLISVFYVNLLIGSLNCICNNNYYGKQYINISNSCYL